MGDPESFMECLVDLVYPLLAVVVRPPLLPADVPGGAQHAADPGEERAESGELIG